MREKAISFHTEKPTNVEPNVLGIPGLFVRGRNSRGITADTRIVKQTRTIGDCQIVDEVVVSRTSHGFPTVNDLSLLFYLFHLFEQQGYPDKIEVRLRNLAEFLGSWWGGLNRQMVLDSLDRLGSTSFLWKSTFQGPADRTSTRERFTLLAYWHQERSNLFPDDANRTPAIEKTFIRLASQISNNLKVGFSIPIDLETFRNLKIDLSKQIYSWACSRLRLEPDEFEKSCRVTSVQLFQELSISGERYSKKSRRKEILVPSVEEVNGQAVPQGFIQASLDETGQDVELVLSIHRPTHPAPQTDQVAPATLVELFLVNFGRSNRQPTQPELDAAADFLSSYPLQASQAETFVAQIAREARQRNYNPTWFSGIRRNLTELAQGTISSTQTTGPVPTRTPAKPRKKMPVRNLSLPMIEASPTVVDLALDDDHEESLVRLGETIYGKLESRERQAILEQKIAELMKSGHKSTFQRWTRAQVEEHAQRLIFKSLATA